ncbi:NAD(P)-dependent glycerol-3-phosphate dehydrogenase [Candidatus Woesearchaeota archaeon]|nr:NAD(P)-dependent glycerol-3-phosphate dehydrogenase [Candidatus Woesearchaeota archaeon]
MHITILGGGSWGTALAVHLARNNHHLNIWEFVEEQARKMQDERICPLLPDAKLQDTIFISPVMEKAFANAELVLIAVPSHTVESTIEQAKKFLGTQPVIICSKGFASNLRLLSDVAQEKVSGKVYCFYGPTHAEEVCKGLFSGAVLAGGSGKARLRGVLESPSFHVELSNDIIGVQVCSALKNILAVFIGVLDGMQAGDNAKAYVMTKGLEEIKEIGLQWGARRETFYGLAGLGDVIVTCSSRHSRNRHVGEQVGQGRRLDDVLAEMKMVAEGVTAVREAIHLKEKFQLELPVITGLYNILFQQKNPHDVLQEI